MEIAQEVGTLVVATLNCPASVSIFYRMASWSCWVITQNVLSTLYTYKYHIIVILRCNSSEIIKKISS